jgi:hypothetical protein
MIGCKHYIKASHSRAQTWVSMSVLSVFFFINYLPYLVKNLGFYLLLVCYIYINFSRRMMCNRFYWNFLALVVFGLQHKKCPYLKFSFQAIEPSKSKSKLLCSYFYSVCLNVQACFVIVSYSCLIKMLFRLKKTLISRTKILLFCRSLKFKFVLLTICGKKILMTT